MQGYLKALLAACNKTEAIGSPGGGSLGGQVSGTKPSASARVGVKCLAILLKSLAHFNHAFDILQARLFAHLSHTVDILQDKSVCGHLSMHNIPWPSSPLMPTVVHACNILQVCAFEGICQQTMPPDYIHVVKNILAICRKSGGQRSGAVNEMLMRDVRPAELLNNMLLCKLQSINMSNVDYGIASAACRTKYPIPGGCVMATAPWWVKALQQACGHTIILSFCCAGCSTQNGAQG